MVHIIIEIIRKFTTINRTCKYEIVVLSIARSPHIFSDVSFFIAFESRKELFFCRPSQHKTCGRKSKNLFFNDSSSKSLGLQMIQHL